MMLNFIYKLQSKGIMIWVENTSIKVRVSDSMQLSSLEKKTIKEEKQKILELLINQGIFKPRSAFIIPCGKMFSVLSYAQERLWFIEEYEGGSNAYHMPMLLELDAEVDESSFEQSLQSIVVRHEVLRTVLGRDDSGIGYQEVLDAALEIEFRNYNGADEFKAQLAEDINSPFDLMKSYPIRVVFYRANSEAHETSKRYVLINIHHIAFDGWSANIFIRELSAYYEHYAKGSALKLKDLSIQYKDYAEWQREYLQEGVLERQSRYWQDQLKGFETLMFPTDKPRPSRIDYSGGNVSFNLGRELSSDLKALAKERGCTLYTVLLSGFYILLHKYTGQLDLIVGTPVANRDYAQLEGLIGFFVNSLGIRAQIESEQRGADLIEQVHKTLVEGQRHQDLPFERLVELLGVDQDQSRHPIFQVMFGLQDISIGDTKYFKIKERGAHYEVAKFDLSLFLKEVEGGLVGAFSYALSLFDVETIERLACHYKVVLTQLVEDLDKPVQSYEVLSREEYQRIVYEWNETDRDYPRDKTIYELFEEQALRVPDKVALIYEGEELTYKELDERTNQLARHIRKCYRHGIGKELEADTLIALYLERSLEMVIGLLGVLKSGGAYVPISPEYPEERVKYILEDTEAEVLLLQSHLVESVKEVTEGIELIALDEGSYREEDVRSLERRSGPDDLAYVIYTSGTTGKPKGVMVEHYSIVNLLLNQLNMFQLHDEETILLFAEYIFDGSVEQSGIALLSGNRLSIPTKSVLKDIFKLEEHLRQNKITHLNMTPSYLQLLSNEFFQRKDLRIITGAELCLPKLYKKCNFITNAYGPTEATVTCVQYRNKLHRSTSIVPIGKAIQNTRVYILDGAGMPVSIGVVGELYIGGAGLARGYLNREELTLERFVPNVFATETDKEKGYGRLYRTGDLVRWLPDGNIEYIGRNDFQVKIRGFRIELGEIEEALSSYEGIKQVSVLARERDSDVGSSGKYLVGYYVSPEAIDSDELFRHISRILPEYMVPSAFVHMESFPLTENGKLERGKLPLPEFVDKTSYVAPSNELESQLCAIWEEVLGLERVGVTDDFFRIGGNSILAMQVAHRVSQSLEIHVSVVDFFSYKTIQQLGVMLKNHNQFIAIPCIAKTHPALSYAQERLWFIEEYEGGSNAYHMPMLLELDAEVDESSFEQSLQSIVVRHEVLRTVLGRDDSGIGYQEVLDAALEIEFRNYNGADEFKAQLAEDINSPFDLMKSYPIRVVFYRASSEAHETSKRYILINIHHIAFDGWSANIFIRELSAYYEHYAKGSALKLKDLSIQYKDYAEWQREYLQEGVLERQSRYWQDQLKGFETLMFPTDKPRPSRIDYSGGNVSFNLGRELSSDLKALAKERGCTLYTVLLSGFYILLHKYTGQLDLIVGTPVANRDYAQLEGLIGFFVNSLGIRAQIESEQRGADLIEQVHKTLVEGQRHQDLPFERLVELLGVDQDQSRHPIFQVMFGLQDISVGDTKYFKIKERGAHYEVAKFDLSLFLKEAEGGLVGAFSYALSLFDVETIERLACHYKVVLTQLVEDLDKPVQSYEVLSREEYQRIVYEWNETDRDYPRDKTIYELFEEQALRVPDKVALIYEGEELTYKELDERTNQLARHIRKCYRHGIGKELEADTLIALYLERSLEMVIGLLGVLKSGGAYVPISPEYPEERVKYILEDTGAEVLLLQSHLVESVKEVTEGIELIALDEGSYREEDVRSLERRSGPDDLAYVIYTSGTTGKPKGVMQLHSNVMRLFTATEDLFHFTAEDIWTLYHSYIFDFSVWEVCGPLFYGGKLVIPSQDQVKDIAKFHQLCVTHNVSILNQTPNAFYQFSDIAAQSQDLLSSLRYIFLGGEALNSKQLLTWWEYCNENGLTSELVNMYGITETTVHVTFKVLSADEKVQSNIGKPIGDLTAYILDGAGMPVSIGVVGELYIGGAGLARGYLNREELTLERFVPNVFATESDKEKGYGRLYRTGDLVRWLPDGNIEYIGRNDFQVKIRGFRIELGEIEEALSSYEGIKQVSVLARERDSDVGSSGKYLVGYYVSPEAIDSDELFRHISRILPEYMVPSAFVHMESFPLTENGKLEKR